MEQPLSPSEPLLVGNAGLILTTTLGTIDDIINTMESLHWEWVGSSRDTPQSIDHIFTMEEVYGDDPDLVVDFLGKEVIEAMDEDRLVEIDIGINTSRVPD